MTFNMNILFLLVFVAFCVQMLVTLLQAKDYRKALHNVAGKGIVGVGHTKGVVKSGQIIILTYNKDKNEIINAQRMKGLTVFARFKKAPEYIGMTLEEIRDLGIKEDQEKFKRRRKKHPYDPEEITKKKAALIQAVEAIDRRIIQDENRIKRVKRLHPDDSFAKKVDPSAFNS